MATLLEKMVIQEKDLSNTLIFDDIMTDTVYSESIKMSSFAQQCLHASPPPKKNNERGGGHVVFTQFVWPTICNFSPNLYVTSQEKCCMD